MGDIRENLDFVGFRLCELIKRNGIQSNMNVFADGLWNSETLKFDYYSPHSLQSVSIFGDPYLSVLISK